MAMATQAGVVTDVRSAIVSGNFALADKILAADVKARGLSADALLGRSWVARGLLDAGRVDEADKQATETSVKSLSLLRNAQVGRRTLPSSCLGCGHRSSRTSACET